MAISIVADDCATVPAHPGVTRTVRWYCNVYSGSVQALIAAGLCVQEELEPQHRRAEGKTAFLPGGAPCPASRRAWRDPGYKAVARQADGTYVIEITVPKEVQQSRRKEREAAAHELEEARVTEEVLARGHRYRNWQLRRYYSDGCESFEGTKAQLQAAGLGQGVRFPGEPGGPKELACKCPLGFEFYITQPNYDRAKTAAGIFVANSPMLPYEERGKNIQLVAVTSGVTRELWTPSSWSITKDLYHGSAAALVDAGIVPALRYFPGQAGANATRSSYLEDWTAASPVHGHGRAMKAVITKRGTRGIFTVELPVALAEEVRRKSARDLHAAKRKKQEEELSNERQGLRETAERIDKSDEEFRNQREEYLEISFDLMWRSVFLRADGPIELEISKGGDLYNTVENACQTIRMALREARIVRDGRRASKARAALKLVSARNDPGLQAVLGAAKGASAIDAIRNRRD